MQSNSLNCMIANSDVVLRVASSTNCDSIPQFVKLVSIQYVVKGLAGVSRYSSLSLYFLFCTGYGANLQHILLKKISKHLSFVVFLLNCLLFI